MSITNYKRSVLLVLLVSGSHLLSGCVAPRANLYQWEGYQPQVYEYFKGNGQGNEAQITVLEADLEKMHAKGKVAPPGYHAHLGLLYTQTGKYDKGAQEFQTEKQLFPESAVYMDLLLKKSVK